MGIGGEGNDQDRERGADQRHQSDDFHAHMYRYFKITGDKLLAW